MLVKVKDADWIVFSNEQRSYMTKAICVFVNLSPSLCFCEAKAASFPWHLWPSPHTSLPCPHWSMLLHFHHIGQNM